MALKMLRNYAPDGTLLQESQDKRRRRTIQNAGLHVMSPYPTGTMSSRNMDHVEAS